MLNTQKGIAVLSYMLAEVSTHRLKGPIPPFTSAPLMPHSFLASLA
jgi:hypothetical protein